MRDRSVFFHWQNLNERKNGKCGFAFWHGRAWLHLWAWVIHWEWHLWSKSCRIGVDLGGSVGGDELVLFCFAIPPVSLYLGIEAPCSSRLWKLMPKREREIKLAIHDWAIWISPWSKQMEWCKADPWWVRGVTIHIDDLILGARKCMTTEPEPSQRIVIELDGREYHGTATFERRVWKRPRWFAFQRDATWISMDPMHGLPHAGKGENGWDCGDDALCGWGVEGFDVPKAIGHGIETVLKYRKRYGNPSTVLA